MVTVGNGLASGLMCFKTVSASETLKESPSTSGSINIIFNNVIVHNHGITPGTVTEAQVTFVYQHTHTHALAEIAVTVRYHGNIFGGLIILLGIHNKGIINGQAVYIINAVVLKHRVQLIIAW